MVWIWAQAFVYLLGLYHLYYMGSHLSFSLSLVLYGLIDWEMAIEGGEIDKGDRLTRGRLNRKQKTT